MLAAVRTMRQRPIRLMPMELPADGPCGLWIALALEDLIFYEADTTRTHRDHIILHEIAHMLCDHGSLGPVDEELGRILFPDLRVEFLRRVLARSGYDNDEEAQAEMLASMLAERIHGRATQALAVDSDVVRRIDQSLAPHRRDQ
ncbi:hypothetical protein [Nocardia sp. NPDC050175]|uniref:hypothetical protein n=1 Tax=Nocardia sp. NPDC050175 TaxID=3364317 RepID=UPI0037AC2D1E